MTLLWMVYLVPAAERISSGLVAIMVCVLHSSSLPVTMAQSIIPDCIASISRAVATPPS